jgi:hypothetical protein
MRKGKTKERKKGKMKKGTRTGSVQMSTLHLPYAQIVGTNGKWEEKKQVQTKDKQKRATYTHLR